LPSWASFAQGQLGYTLSGLDLAGENYTMKLFQISLLTLFAVIYAAIPSYALIKIDDDSIDLAIKYGLKMKGQETRDILGNNWISDSEGRVLTVYSPFIQLVTKSNAQASTGNPDEDIKNVKNNLSNEIKKISNKNEVRFIVDLYGDTPDFAKNCTSFIIDENEYNSNSKEKNFIKPKKQTAQKIADKDNYDPKHPFSAINLYTYKFDTVSKLKEYYLVIVSSDGKETKFKVNNSQIF